MAKKRKTAVSHGYNPNTKAKRAKHIKNVTFARCVIHWAQYKQLIVDTNLIWSKHYELIGPLVDRIDFIIREFQGFPDFHKTAAALVEAEFQVKQTPFWVHVMGAKSKKVYVRNSLGICRKIANLASKNTFHGAIHSFPQNQALNAYWSSHE